MKSNYIASLLLFICSAHANADIFKCTDSEGHVRYANTMQEGCKQLNLEPVTTTSSKPAPKAEKKKDGVRLGMTPAEVKKSSWGAPHSVHRTVNAYGVSEQWVFSSGNYLYFENGKLTSIQN